MAREQPDTPVELKVRALRYLARREHSRAELARKLVPYAESAQALAALLDELAGRKQLSDERYAETRAHWLARKYGAAKIRADLKAHGIADAIAERVSSEGEDERARAILARKYRQPATTREERARRARFLQSRGFSFETIHRALALAESD
ncbi:MAG: recombination regulator RecX [Betaproteobacteria bacterium]|nr:MAG: recombination regulator RecX [Betaproteobacteria bacterium]